LVKQIHLTITPKLLISLKVDVPMAIGWLKPVVLLPANMITGLNSAQLEMLILHELAHIRRHDYLVNFLQTLVEILLFFHQQCCGFPSKCAMSVNIAVMTLPYSTVAMQLLMLTR